VRSRPSKISASRSTGLLIIEWEDGHHSEYPLAGLRTACPCAECRGIELESMQGVGNYALQLVWKDGHAYGIYTWQYLRQLCPCGEKHLEL
jgi:DUF971 family protein